jgi:hypothetical protein
VGSSIWAARSWNKEVQGHHRLIGGDADDWRALVEMVLCWKENHDDLRFGQWLWAVCGGDPFYIEDSELAEKITGWFENHPAVPGR